MATNVLMPKWGLSMQEGTVLSWLKQQGDPVEKGEEIVEIESEKASNFVEAPASGVLARVVVPEGDTVPVTTIIAVIAADGEEVAEVPEPSPSQPVAPPPAESARGVETSGPTAKSAPRGSRDATPRRRVPASPAARRLAQKHELDLAELSGTGPEGMIKVEDVQTALSSAQAPATSPVTRVSFYSQGHKLDGVFYLPKD